MTGKELTGEQIAALRDRAMTPERRKARAAHDQRLAWLQENGIAAPKSGTYGKPPKS